MVGSRGIVDPPRPSLGERGHPNQHTEGMDAHCRSSAGGGKTPYCIGRMSALAGTWPFGAESNRSDTVNGRSGLPSPWPVARRTPPTCAHYPGGMVNGARGLLRLGELHMAEGNRPHPDDGRSTTAKHIAWPSSALHDQCTGSRTG